MACGLFMHFYVKIKLSAVVFLTYAASNEVFSRLVLKGLILKILIALLTRSLL